MHLKNTEARYGAVSKTFHWIIALGIIFMLCLGFYMGGAEGLSKLKLYNLHKSIGITILTLALMRVLWNIYSQTPPFVSSMKKWEKHAAHALHICLYLGMIGMPLSGWLLSSTAGRPVHVFGLFQMPDIIGPNENLRDIFGTLHWITAWCLVAALPVHVGAALKHHFIAKDDTLRRMLPFGKK